MMIGVPRETKEGERRVALLPEAVEELTAAGHDILVETHAGLGVGFGDDDYRDAGADIVTAKDVWDCELIVKVKEVQEADLRVMPKGVAIFSYHHLPDEPKRTQALAAKGATAIAFEMVRDAAGRFPLLAPMSMIAGRMSIAIGTKLLGHKPASVLVLGAGHAGKEAARVAKAAGVPVTVLSRTPGSGVEAATTEAVERHALAADLVVGAVFVAGQPTPKLLPRSLVKRMKHGAVIVDISIDAGGVAETSRPTTHAQPSYVEEGVTHYCVANIPAANPSEASAAISDAVLPYVMDIADGGIAGAMLANPDLRKGVLLWLGKVNHPGIAAEAGLPYTELTDATLAESE